jgi:diguanylate cyclase (GGDEF)-like protein
MASACPECSFLREEFYYLSKNWHDLGAVDRPVRRQRPEVVMREYLKSCFSRLFAGDLSSFGGPSTEEPVAGQIRAEQICLVLRNSPGMMLANACNATVLAIALSQSPDGIYAALWAAVMVFGSTVSGLKARSSWRVTKPQSVSRGSIHRLVRNAFISGAMWAIVPIGFFEQANPGGQMLMTGLCAGLLAGGAFAFATIPVAAIGFMGPIFLGSAICIARAGDFVYLLIAVLVVVYACVLLRGVFAYSFEFTRRMIAHLETEKAVRQDSLTKLPNRFAFNERLEGALVRLAGSGEECAVLLLDLDHFKEVNDQLGHLAGDEFLTQLAARLRRCTRDTDFAARIGGDEFGIIAANITKLDEAFKLAEEIVSTFDHPFLIEGRELVGAASIGISLAPRDGNTSNDLLKHADVALYRAKKAGPGTVRFFEPGDDASARERRELQGDLEGAIERNELFLVYQPFLSLREHRITGFEALLRWRHPARGLLSPIEFIALAEESGLIHSIGDWVVRRACKALSQWPANIRVAVNVSAVQFQNANILQTFVRALAEARVTPGRLEIEITESILLSKYDSAPSVLNSLLELGVTVALDDFGTGYSSLTYLRRLPFSRIKIDQSFVRDMLVQPDCAAIVKSVIGLAQDLQIGVVAEGVESAEQLDYLGQTNCDEVQGYLIGRPVEADQVLALLDEQEQNGVKQPALITKFG